MLFEGNISISKIYFYAVSISLADKISSNGEKLFFSQIATLETLFKYWDDDPSKVKYDQSLMHQHFISCIENEYFTKFPSVKTSYPFLFS